MPGARTATGMAFAKYLTAEDLVSQRDLVAALATQLGYQFWDTDRQSMQPGVEEFVPAELARRLTIVPLAVDGNRLMVAMEDPSNEAAVDEIALASGLAVTPVLAMRADVMAALSHIYPAPVNGRRAGAPGGDGPADGQPDVHLDELLANMIKLGASDLHLSVGITPTVRVDGRMRSAPRLPPARRAERAPHRVRRADAETARPLRIRARAGHVLLGA